MSHFDDDDDDGVCQKTSKSLGIRIHPWFCSKINGFFMIFFVTCNSLVYVSLSLSYFWKDFIFFEKTNIVSFNNLLRFRIEKFIFFNCSSFHLKLHLSVYIQVITILQLMITIFLFKRRKKIITTHNHDRTKVNTLTSLYVLSKNKKKERENKYKKNWW